MFVKNLTLKRCIKIISQELEGTKEVLSLRFHSTLWKAIQDDTVIFFPKFHVTVMFIEKFFQRQVFIC